MIATAHSIIRNAPAPFDAEIALDYEGRLLRRKRLACAGGDFMVDLPEVTSLDDGDAFELSDGRRIVVRAAPEPVLVVRGNLPRLAWHIGNRHTPCRIEADRLIIRQDHVLEAMLAKLGADICRRDMPFRPEGGAYGHGRTFGHDHGGGGGHGGEGGHGGHDHRHGQGHGHGHDHGHGHGHSHASGHAARVPRGRVLAVQTYADALPYLYGRHHGAGEHARSRLAHARPEASARAHDHA